MHLYQVYFFVLKIVVLAQVVLLSLGYKVAESPMFAIVDTVFKISLGLFLGIYFWLFRPKGINWEDGIIISVGGFLILTEVEFGPLMEIYKLRDSTTKTVGRTVGV
jgi:uncharacterized membrane protein